MGVTPPEDGAEAGRGGPPGGRAASFLSLAVFDVGGPLALYYALRGAGSSEVVALIVSGLLPAVGIGLGLYRHRRIDAVGAVVLFGIAVAIVVGLVSGSARLVLLDGAVPTAALGLMCFGSLLTERPLMFRMAQQFIGAVSAQGRDFAAKWRYREFRRLFVVITAAWGAAFLAETAGQIVIIERASAGTAKTTANLLPVAVAAVMVAATVLYGRWQRRRGEPAAPAPVNG